MQKEVKISVIIPAYNVAEHISRTVDSVFKQNLPNKCMEVIVVNDGSTDNTLKVLHELSQVHHQLCIINSENGGVSKARNLGIHKASGDYISFLDGDDSWDSDFLREMLLFINNNNLKCAGCLFSRVENGKVIHVNRKVPENNDLLEWYIGSKGMTINTNSWLIDTKIIFENNISFFEGSQFGEDTEFFTKVILYSGKENWSLLKKPLTYYHIRKGSLTNPTKRIKIDKIEMYFESFRRTFNHMNKFSLQKGELGAFKKRVYLYYIAYLSSILIKGEKSDYIKLKERFKADKREMTMKMPNQMSSIQYLRSVLIYFDFIFYFLKKKQQ